MGEAIAIVSDIHANIEAFRAVLEDIIEVQMPAHNVTEIHCLGDTVGYGPSPVECINLARKRFSSNLMGNHEEAACYLDNSIIDEVCKRHAAVPVKWIREAIFRTNPEIFEYMRSLPAINLPNKNDLQKRIAEVHGSLCIDAQEADESYHQFVHPKKKPHDAATCSSINRYSTSTPEESMKNLSRCFDSLKKLKRNICFVGHVHCAEAFEDTGDANNLTSFALDFGSKPEESAQSHVQIDKNSRYVINPGSVGQPRDGNRKASYCIFTGEYVLFRRVPYNYHATMLKLLLKASIPDDIGAGLAARLYDAR